MATVAGGLNGGSIDGGVVSPPTLFAVEKLGFKELINITDMDFAFPNPSLVAVGTVLKSRPEVINRFMRAYARGIQRAKNDRGFTYKSMTPHKNSGHDSSGLVSTSKGAREGALHQYGGYAGLEDLAKTVRR
jgi:hypothetical protein